MITTRLLAASAMGAVLLLPAMTAYAQKGAAAQLPAQQQAIITRNHAVGAPKLGNAATAAMDTQRRMRDFEQFMDLVLDDARDVVRGIREGQIGAAPGISDAGIGTSPGRDTGRAVDRVGPRKAGQGSPYGSEYENPLGSTMSGIDGRMRGNKPRSTVVGATQPGSAGIASTGVGKSPNYSTTFPWSRGHDGGVDRHGTTTTTHDQRTGATVTVAVVSYADLNDRLVSWSHSRVDNMGKSTTTTHTVRYLGDDRNVPVVTTKTQVRNGDGEVLSESTPTERPYDPEEDPPLEGTQVAEGGGSTGFDGPLGMTCNPITGVCGPGLKLGAAQVNPGRLEQSAARTRLRMDPRGAVINPDPDAFENVGTPNPIDRDGKGPGAKPPRPH